MNFSTSPAGRLGLAVPRASAAAVLARPPLRRVLHVAARACPCDAPHAQRRMLSTAPTRALLAKDTRRSSPAEVVDGLFGAPRDDDGLGGSASSSSPLDLSLFEDPSGGLAAGPAEELSAAELAAQLQLLVSAYSPDVYHLLYTPLVDVVALVFSEGLAPTAAELAGATRALQPGEVMARWFADGPATLRDPQSVPRAMGAERWQALARALRRHWAETAAVTPLARAAAHHGVHAPVLLPFLRQLTMELAEPQRRRAVVGTVPGLTLALANGRAPASLRLPERQAARCLALAELFLAVGQETGNTDLAFLGTQLLRTNDLPTPYALQKRLTSVFAASARVQNDWQLRQSGQLAEALPRWSTYFRRVRADLGKGREALRRREGERQPGKGKGTAASAESDADSRSSASPTSAPAAYFASRSAESVARVAALEESIRDAVVRSGERAYAVPPPPASSSLATGGSASAAGQPRRQRRRRGEARGGAAAEADDEVDWPSEVPVSSAPTSSPSSSSTASKAAADLLAWEEEEGDTGYVSSSDSARAEPTSQPEDLTSAPSQESGPSATAGAAAAVEGDESEAALTTAAPTAGTDTRTSKKRTKKGGKGKKRSDGVERKKGSDGSIIFEL